MELAWASADFFPGEGKNFQGGQEPTFCLKATKKILFFPKKSKNCGRPCELGNVTHGSVDFLVEVGLLQLERPRVVLNLCVRVVLHVHGCLLAFGLTNTGVTISLKEKKLITTAKITPYTSVFQPF
jgi:hypothetical protein